MFKLFELCLVYEKRLNAYYIQLVFAKVWRNQRVFQDAIRDSLMIEYGLLWNNDVTKIGQEPGWKI